MTAFELCTHQDLEYLNLVQDDSINSFSQLHSIMGYSQTEWIKECESKEHDCRIFCMKGPKQPLAFVRVYSRDDLSLTAQFQILCCKSGDLTQVKDALKKFLEKLGAYEHTSRFYSCVFSQECVEESLLLHMGFEQEVILIDHHFMNNRYENIHIWGNHRWSA